MNKTEYKEKKKEIKQEYEEKIKKLNKEYATSNQFIQIGDIVASEFSTIKIEQITFMITYTNEVMFNLYGVKVTKKGKPYKNKNKDSFNSNSIETINGVPYDATKK